MPQQSGFRRAFEYAGAAVELGYSILVFPEGRVTTDGAMRPFMPGIGLLARDLAIPIIPVYIDGLYELKARRRWIAWPGSVTLRFGKPYIPDNQQPVETWPQVFCQFVAELNGDE